MEHLPNHAPLERPPDPLLRERLARRLLATGLVLAAAVVAATLWQHRREQASHADVLHAQRRLAALEAVLVQSLNLQTGARGFLLTGDEAFLAPFTLGRASIGGALDDLARLADAASVRRVDDLRTQVAGLQVMMERQVDLRRSAGPEAAVAQVPLLTTKRQMDDLRDLIRLWETEEARRLETTLLELDRRQRLTALNLVGGGGTALGLLALLAASQRRQLRLSARARAAAELNLAEAQAIARLGSWQLDVGSGRGAWSDEMFRLTGFPREDGPPPLAAFLARVHPDDRPALEARHAAAGARGEGFQLEFRYLSPGKELRWLEARVRAAGPAGDRAERLEGTLLDVTERRAATAAAEESETRLRLALDASRTGVFDWDLASGRIVWSRWHEEIWGYAPGGFPGTFAAFAARVHPEDLPGIEAEVARCLAGRVGFEREFRVVHPDGTQRWVAARGEFEFDAAGRPRRMRGAVLDFTRRRRAEEQLAVERDRSRTLARRLLSAQEDERRRLAHELHDELGQTLTALKLSLQSSQRDRPADPRLDSAIGIAAAGLNQTRDLSLRLRPPLLDDLGLLPALRWLVDRSGGGPEVRLETDGDETRLAIETETAAFRIAQEALTNALRHAEASVIAIDVRRDSGALVVAVQDDGRGFDFAATRARVVQAGTSLGLLGLAERAELAGGVLAVDSTPGRGTRVTVRFPPPAPAP
jgi:PAS domain S-box-containing protein